MAALKLYETILFDEDGTLIDSKAGILRCFEYSLTKMGALVPAETILTWCIGPALRDSFAKLLNTSNPTTIEMALAYFRDRYATIGLFESVPYPGVDKMLEKLQDAGCRLFVVTSNATLYAKEIIAHFSLAKYFEQVYGPTLDGIRDDKVDLIKFVLSENKLDPNTTLMVGDRLYDVDAAHKNNIAGLGVTYGYGSVTELTGAAAIALCDSAAAIATWILDAKVLL